VRKLEARVEDESIDRVEGEKKLRSEIETRIVGVEKHIEVEIGGRIQNAQNDIDSLREQLLTISAQAAGEQGDVQGALQKVRRDIEVTCETLLEEQMKLRGKVLERVNTSFLIFTSLG